MVLVETIHDTPSLGKEIPMMIQLSFSIFLAQLDKMRDGKGGLLHVIVTFAVCTLLVEMVQQNSILIQYQLLPVKKR